MNSAQDSVARRDGRHRRDKTVQLFYMQTKLVKMGYSPIIQFDVFLRLAMATAQTNMRTL